jgi:hypothetical protein
VPLCSEIARRKPRNTHDLFGDVRPESVNNDAPEDRGHATQLAETRAQLELERAKNGLLAERVEELKGREAELREDRDRWRA